MHEIRATRSAGTSPVSHQYDLESVPELPVVGRAEQGIEAVGLWYTKRWAEYLTFIATTILLPLETHRGAG